MSPRIMYTPKAFGAVALDRVEKVNDIVRSYAAQGFSLTLRQVYYQFVARGWIPNKDSEYKRLGALVSDARLAGLVDWYAIEDRTRYLRAHYGSESPEAAIRGMARGYSIDLWEGQPTYVEAWIEKDALVGILESACDPRRAPFFSCRGYVSQSEMWGAAQRLIRKVRDGGFERVVILHLGDHDPSGLDMTRDIEDRLSMFTEGLVDLEVRRLALNMDQVRQYDPPPNPAKVTDSRAAGYIALHGRESWELDALEPQVLSDLVSSAIEVEVDEGAWQERQAREDEEQEVLQDVADRWDDVRAFLEA